MAKKILRVQVKPGLVRWARERAGKDIQDLQGKFPYLEDWETGAVQPTIKQLERFANATRVPFGYLFLNEPPEEPLPIPDFRTVVGEARRPSPDLLDTIYTCQQRQEWFQGYLQMLGEEPLDFVGSASLQADPIRVATAIRDRLHFGVDERRKLRTWEEALRLFIDQTEGIRVLVMVTGTVGSNTHRKLDPKEFRGFTLVDSLAPLIFVNGADTKAAQMFTLAHELAHVWLGQTGVSDSNPAVFTDERVERWCNRVAAELLVPSDALKETFRPESGLQDELQRLARYFKVSTLVILRRIFELGALQEDEFWRIYHQELDRLVKFKQGGVGGGDFYRTLNRRVGSLFAEAVVVSALEGHTLLRDAYQMLGIRKTETFERYAKELGVA
jgi:Zn-dependent peptidase ImmA (M78 family)